MTNKEFDDELAKQKKEDPTFLLINQESGSRLYRRVYRKNGQIRVGRRRWTTRRGALLMSSRGAR